MIPPEADRLFQLPLSEFIAARNALAAQLKKDRRAADSVLVKAMPKPPVSVWAVNQLYRNHRSAFDRLIDAGKTFREAQLAQFKGGSPDAARQATSVRRDALAALLRLADALLRDGGHNASQETLRRISVTLEAVSALPEPPPYGQLTADLDPPGFDVLASWMPDTVIKPAVPSPTAVKPVSAPEPPSRSTKVRAELADAERVLHAAREKAAEAEAAMRRAASVAMQSEFRMNQAREAYERSKAESDEGAARARQAATASDEAGRLVGAAEEAVEQLTKTLKRLKS